MKIESTRTSITVRLTAEERTDWRAGSVTQARARGKVTTAEGRHHGPKPVVSVVYGDEYVDGGPF